MATHETTWITTPRLVLRRPTAGDLDDYVRLHTDPRTYSHAPQAMPDEAGCRERLERELVEWQTQGVGYAAVLDRASGEVVGWSGLRVEGDLGAPHFNLYYRLGHDWLGRGRGRELARAVTAWALEHRPDVPVQAAVDPGNDRSLATARAAGLLDVGMSDPDDGPRGYSMHLLRAPIVEDVPAERVPIDDLLDLWTRVNDAGGAVGFLPGAPRVEVLAALRPHLDALEADRARLVTLREADGVLRGFGFWHHGARLPFEHVAVLKRLMVDPGAQGRNLGRLLLAGMVGIARRELPQVELLRLDYRSGLGLGDFYASCGWSEVGRVPLGLWLGGDDYRDEVQMARRVDGGMLTVDGRT
jgi:RimJ/RimL family protein N-acetyltransferase